MDEGGRSAEIHIKRDKCTSSAKGPATGMLNLAVAQTMRRRPKQIRPGFRGHFRVLSTFRNKGPGLIDETGEVARRLITDWLLIDIVVPKAESQTSPGCRIDLNTHSDMINRDIPA